MAKTDFFFGATDTGRQRSNNEDAFIVQPVAAEKMLGCVIDGVGGYEGGEVAAAIAQKTMSDAFKQPAGDALQKLKIAFVQTNERIYEDRLHHPDRNNMACVLTAVVTDTEHNQFQYAHVGDTRLYLLRDDSLVKVTKDHSFVGFLEDQKKISEAEAMSHPKRNEVNKALGFDPNMSRVADYIETGSSPFLPGDLLMLCSDGLTDLVDHQQMTSILTSPSSLKEKTQQLIDTANAAGGKDNITVVLIQNSNKSIKQKKTKPVTVKKAEPPAPAEPQNQTVTPAPVFKKSSNSFSAVLFILCLLLGATAYYFWNENRKIKSMQAETSRSPQPLGASQQRLLDSLEVSPFLFLDSSYGKNILITDTIQLNKDSFYINGNGTVFQAGSGYGGPLFFAGENCRYISLENIVIENFDVGLIAQSKILRLQNVIFRNCRIPVQQGFLLPLNNAVSGTLIDTVLFKPDSLAKRQR